jgi:hypothetical protein
MESNQIKNTAIGKIYIGSDIAKFVQRATALEMERSGIILDDRGGRVVVGNIRDITADDLGYSVDWSYSIEYSIMDVYSEKHLFSQLYTATPRTTGKFGQASDYTTTLNDMVRDAIEQFLRDEEAMELLATGTATAGLERD